MKINVNKAFPTKTAQAEYYLSKGTFVFTENDILQNPMLDLKERNASPQKRQVQNLANLAKSDTFIDDLVSEAIKT